MTKQDTSKTPPVAAKTVNITESVAEWTKYLAATQVHFVSPILIEDCKKLAKHADGFMLKSAAVYGERPFACMSVRVKTMEDVLILFKEEKAKGKKIFLYMLLEDKNAGTKTLRYNAV
jgi:hypothetical protein